VDEDDKLGVDNTARRLNAEASQLFGVNASARAKPQHVSTLDIMEKALGPQHPDTAASLADLASLYKSAEQPLKARSDCSRAIRIREQDLQPSLQLDDSRRSAWQKAFPDSTLAAETSKPEQLAQCVLRWRGVALDLVGGSICDLIREPVHSAGEKKMIVFANPEFAGKHFRHEVEPLQELRAASLNEFTNIHLSPLPCAKAGGKAVARIAKEAGWNAKLKTAADASERALTGAKAPKVLHYVTHGFFPNENGSASGSTDSAQGMQAKPALESDPESVLAGGRQLEQTWGPMRRSGLTLAEVHRTFDAWGHGEAPSPDPDGVLTAEETAFLDLTGTWMVTLSACETGLGKAQNGEGVFGLRRATMLAGASNLLVTLWPVSDDTTGQIMADFYAKALATGKGWETLAEFQRGWLVKLRTEKGMHRRRPGFRGLCHGRDGEPSQNGIGWEMGSPTLTECQQTSKLSP
jgi:hypothetical protein